MSRLAEKPTPAQAAEALRGLPGVVDCRCTDSGLVVQLTEEALQRSLPEILRQGAGGLPFRLEAAGCEAVPPGRLPPEEFLL